jgi:hypothetical protein
MTRGHLEYYINKACQYEKELMPPNKKRRLLDNTASIYGHESFDIRFLEIGCGNLSDISTGSHSRCLLLKLAIGNWDWILSYYSSIDSYILSNWNKGVLDILIGLEECYDLDQANKLHTVFNGVQRIIRGKYL